MIKLNTKHQPLNLSYSPSLEGQATRRLIIPVQNPEANLNDIVRRIWELADTTGADVKFIGVCANTTQELVLRRTLTTISALVNDEHVYAEYEIVLGKDFVHAVQSRLQPGDSIVCWGESHTGTWRKPVNPLLQEDFGIPVYFISGSAPTAIARPSWVTQLFLWIGLFVIIAGFFWLQVQIGNLNVSDSAATILQVISVAGEIALIWLWNSLLG